MLVMLWWVLYSVLIGWDREWIVLSFFWNVIVFIVVVFIRCLCVFRLELLVVIFGRFFRISCMFFSVMFLDIGWYIGVE